MAENQKPKIIVSNNQTLSDLEQTAQSVSASIDNLINNLPPELGNIFYIAIGAAIGTKFPKLTLFLGGIYLAGKILSGQQTVQRGA